MRHCISALCLSLVAINGSLSFANAADLSMQSMAPPTYATKGWTGGYLGIQGGKTWSKGGIELGDHGGAVIPLDVQNGLFFREKEDLRGTITVGATAGYNFELNNRLVVGIEADVTPLSLSVTHTNSRIDPNPIAPFTGQLTNSEYQTKFDTFGTMRLRAGVTFGKTLVYVTAGLAGGNVRNRFAIGIPGLGYQSPNWSESGMRYGYAIGGGVEHKITNNMSIKAEGLMVDLADRTVRGVDPVSFPGEYISYKFDNNLLLGRVGINYAF